MKRNGPRPQNVDDYIDVAPEASRRKLLEMRACVSKAAPGAEETLKYGMPAFCYQRILVIFGGFKNHIGFYPTGRAMKPFAKELAKFKKSRGAVQFPLDQPLPRALIRKIVNREENKKEKHANHSGNRAGGAA